MSDVVPEGWKTYCLSEYSTSRRGTTYVSSELSEDKERFPLYINMKSFKVNGGYNKNGDKFFSSKYSPKQLVKYNDILIANTDVTDTCDILGAPIYIPQEKLKKDILFSHHVSALNISQNIDILFLYYIFCSQKMRIEMKRIGRGTTVKMLDMKDVEKISLSFPPLPEQKKIASILTAVDDVIEKTQSKINKLQDLKKVTINELLTKGIGHTEFKDSELGRIPKEWKIYELNNVSEKIGDGLHATPKYTENSDFYFINGNNLFNGKIIFGNSTKKISKEEFKKHYIGLGKNTILLSINGTIGNVAKYDFEKIILGKSAAYINLKKNILRDFIYYCLQSNYISKYFNFEVTGTTIKNLSLKSIKKIKIKFPLIKEQNLIVKILNHKENNIIIYNQLLKKYKNLKKSLMQDLLTGKVRVSVN